MKNTEGKTFDLSKTFRVATYNVENYLDDTAPRCCVKSAASKAKVCECIRALRPDVLALQEIGSVAALLELRAALQAEGLDFPHWEHVIGSDANVHVAILSRFPFSARRPNTNIYQVLITNWRCLFYIHGRKSRTCAMRNLTRTNFLDRKNIRRKIPANQSIKFL
jgi:hypothetical protein